VNSESDRYFRASDADLDKFGVFGRLQYVDPTIDQASSPYLFERRLGNDRSARQRRHSIASAKRPSAPGIALRPSSFD
jgi:hypothetical protein